MASVTSQVRVEGVARLRSTIKRAGGDLNDFSRLNREVASMVLPAVKRAAPMGPAAGGHIVNTVRAGGTRRAAVIRVGTKAKPYAGPTHWGWPARNIKPNPWAATAVRAAEPLWTARYFAGLETIIRKIEGIPR